MKAPGLDSSHRHLQECGKGHRVHWKGSQAPELRGRAGFCMLLHRGRSMARRVSVGPVLENNPSWILRQYEKRTKVGYGIGKALLHCGSMLLQRAFRCDTRWKTRHSAIAEADSTYSVPDLSPGHLGRCDSDQVARHAWPLHLYTSLQHVRLMFHRFLVLKAQVHMQSNAMRHLNELRSCCFGHAARRTLLAASSVAAVSAQATGQGTVSQNPDFEIGSRKGT